MLLSLNLSGNLESLLEVSFEAQRTIIIMCRRTDFDILVAVIQQDYIFTKTQTYICVCVCVFLSIYHHVGNGGTEGYVKIILCARAWVAVLGHYTTCDMRAWITHID